MKSPFPRPLRPDCDVEAKLMYQRGTSSEASATLFREAIALVDLKRYDLKRFEPALKQLWQGAHDDMVEHLRSKLEKYCRNTFCSNDRRISVIQFSIHLTLDVRRPRNRFSIHPILFQSNLTKVSNGGSERCGISGVLLVRLLELCSALR